MADIQKKMAAAMAAVSAYLQAEEATVQALSIVEPATPQYQQNLWSQSGRQDMMTMRRLVQMRAFTRCR